MKKKKKLFGRTITVLALCYLGLLLFPQILFANKLEYKNFTVYYHSDLINTEDFKFILDNSIQLLERSELFKNDLQQKLFVCDSYAEFTFFSLRSRKAFAVNYTMTQNIFLTKSNIKENSIKRNGNQYNKRVLSGVIAHETTHSLLENHLGILKYKILPSWKNEGYCDFIANESSYKTADSKIDICNNSKSSQSPSFMYFKYRMLTQYVFKKEGMTLDEFLNNDYDLKQLENHYCNN